MKAGSGRAGRIGRLVVGWLRSVEHRLRGLAPVTVGLAGLVVATEIVHGFRVFGTPWFGGDLLYHQALAHEILRGEFPPAGPYVGLPTYYPPGFHLLLAASMAVTGLDAVRADQLLTLAWLPVLPVGTFLLVRQLTGRPWVALAAAILTVFGGAYDLRPGRLWVNSLFPAGQEAYPLFPRDVVFGLLPFAVLAILQALRPTRRRREALGWAVLGGALFGVAGLVQVQLLLPLPAALLVTAAVVAVRDPSRRWIGLASVAVSGLVATLLVAPWFVGQLDAIRQNGGVALDSAESLEPARIGFWNYPRQFGLFLPLGLIGAGASLLFLRRPEGPSVDRRGGAWRPEPVEGPVFIVAWWALAFGLAVLYRPDWPLEDALRPQRLWLLSGQPLIILASIGLTAMAEVVVSGRWRRPELAVPAIVIVIVAACLPTTTATVGLLAGTWAKPTYAHLDLAADRVPDLRSLLGDRGSPGGTVLTYEDWSSLTWYLTGRHVVAVVPAGFAKLAYDPAVFTGHGQAERRAALGHAFSGDPAALAGVADAYGASLALVARRDGGWGLIDASAALGTAMGPARIVAGNGWDGVELAADAALELTAASDGLIDLEIRLVGSIATPAGVERRLSLVARGDGEDRVVGQVVAPPTTSPFQVIRARVVLGSGERLAIRTDQAVTIQSVRGFVPLAAPPIGWRIVADTPDATLLERVH